MPEVVEDGAVSEASPVKMDKLNGSAKTDEEEVKENGTKTENGHSKARVDSTAVGDDVNRESNKMSGPLTDNIKDNLSDRLVVAQDAKQENVEKDDKCDGSDGVDSNATVKTRDSCETDTVDSSHCTTKTANVATESQHPDTDNNGAVDSTENIEKPRQSPDKKIAETPGLDYQSTVLQSDKKQEVSVDHEQKSDLESSAKISGALVETGKVVQTGEIKEPGAPILMAKQDPSEEPHEMDIDTNPSATVHVEKDRSDTTLKSEEVEKPDTAEECEEADKKKIKECKEADEKKTQECKEADEKKTQECKETDEKKSQECEKADEKKSQECEKADEKKTQESKEADEKKTQESKEADEKKTQESKEAGEKNTQDCEEANEKQTQESEDVDEKKNEESKEPDEKKNQEFKEANEKKNLESKEADEKKNLESKEADEKKNLESKEADEKKNLESKEADEKKNLESKEADEKKNLESKEADEKKNLESKEADEKKTQECQEPDEMKSQKSNENEKSTADGNVELKDSKDCDLSQKSDETKQLKDEAQVSDKAPTGGNGAPETNENDNLPCDSQEGSSKTCDTKVPEELDSMITEGRACMSKNNFNAAADLLGQACEKLRELFGELDQRCAECYYYYGSAMLECAKTENSVLGEAVNKEESESDEEEIPMVKEKEDNADEIKEDSEEMEEDSKPDDEPMETDAEEKSQVEVNEENCEITLNKEEEEEEDTTLKAAWETLELAKFIFEKQNNVKMLADTYMKLGEVAVESGHKTGFDDMKKSLELRKTFYGLNHRAIPETHFNIGLSYSLFELFDEAIQEFETSKNLLENRIKMLEKSEATDINIEIKEIKGLLPDIDEKIKDMKESKVEKAKAENTINNQQQVGKSSDAGTGTGVGTGSGASKGPKTDKPNTTVSNLTHLIKRKRKIEEVAEPTNDKQPKQPCVETKDQSSL